MFSSRNRLQLPSLDSLFPSLSHPSKGTTLGTLHPESWSTEWLNLRLGKPTELALRDLHCLSLELENRGWIEHPSEALQAPAFPTLPPAHIGSGCQCRTGLFGFRAQTPPGGAASKLQSSRIVSLAPFGRMECHIVKICLIAGIAVPGNPQGRKISFCKFLGMPPATTMQDGEIIRG